MRENFEYLIRLINLGHDTNTMALYTGFPKEAILVFEDALQGPRNYL